MIVEKIVGFFFGLFLGLLRCLPTLQPLKPPVEFNAGLTSVFKIIGYFMPYNLYAPLITFILGLTAFRIVYAIYLVITKR